MQYLNFVSLQLRPAKPETTEYIYVLQQNKQLFYKTDSLRDVFYENLGLACMFL